MTVFIGNDLMDIKITSRPVFFGSSGVCHFVSSIRQVSGDHSPIPYHSPFGFLGVYVGLFIVIISASNYCSLLRLKCISVLFAILKLIPMINIIPIFILILILLLFLFLLSVISRRVLTSC